MRAAANCGVWKSLMRPVLGQWANRRAWRGSHIFVQNWVFCTAQAHNGVEIPVSRAAGGVQNDLNLGSLISVLSGCFAKRFILTVRYTPPRRPCASPRLQIGFTATKSHEEVAD
jgi:hypothetical protein